MGRLRWKLHPKEKGLRAIMGGPRGSTLHDGVENFATVQAIERHCNDGWFWYARNDKYGVPLTNTWNTPAATVDEAKAQAMAYVKQHLASYQAQDGKQHG